jgi:SAM-dependent methyltransferase
MSAAGYVHPRALSSGGESDYSLDIAENASTNYARWVADLCAPHLGSAVLDLGAGFGAITTHIAEGREVTVLDSSSTCIAALNARFADTPNVCVVEGDLASIDGRAFDSILMTNVLEHIRDDAQMLATLRTRHLLPGGTIVLYVPALNALYTNWDRKIGHYRRYSKRRLAGVAAEAGLSVALLHYVNFLAIPAWLITGRLVDREGRTTQAVSTWDTFAVPVSRALESRVRLPIGLNLLCVLKVEAAS